jgi:hypothetical protein
MVGFRTSPSVEKPLVAAGGEVRENPEDVGEGYGESGGNFDDKDPTTLPAEGLRE